MKTQHILILGMIGIIILNIGIAIAVYDLPGRTVPLTMPNGSPIPPELDESIYDISNIFNSLPDSELNTLNYKIFVPEDNGTQWNLSGYNGEVFESKPYFLLKPKVVNGVAYLSPYTGRGLQYAWVCCNVSLNDRLYTADASANSSLRGTLTNLYNINYKSRYPYDNGSFRNLFVGASQNKGVYNRRASLSQDGTQIAYAMETRNVSVSGVPELMKVFLV